jgi:hypothetical protein
VTRVINTHILRSGAEDAAAADAISASTGDNRMQARTDRPQSSQPAYQDKKEVWGPNYRKICDKTDANL